MSKTILENFRLEYEFVLVLNLVLVLQSKVPYYLSHDDV